MCFAKFYQNGTLTYFPWTEGPRAEGPRPPLPLPYQQQRRQRVPYLAGVAVGGKPEPPARTQSQAGRAEPAGAGGAAGGTASSGSAPWLAFVDSVLPVYHATAAVAAAIVARCLRPSSSVAVPGTELNLCREVFRRANAIDYVETAAAAAADAALRDLRRSPPATCSSERNTAVGFTYDRAEGRGRKLPKEIEIEIASVVSR